MKKSILDDFTIDDWSSEVKNVTGIGVSDDDMYPLSSYHPINKEQSEIIKNYYYVLKKSIITIDDYRSQLDKIIDRLLNKSNSSYTFNEKYPTFNHFAQAVANQSTFVSDSSELYPNIEYHPISQEQLEMIQTEYLSKSKKDFPYLDSDLTSFASNIILLSDTPLNLLPTLVNNGQELVVS